MRRATECVLTVLLAMLVCVAMPQAAFAETIEELQQQILELNEEYGEASNRVEELDGLIEENEGRIQEIEDSLPGQREKAAESLRTLYRMQQAAPGLVDLVLSSENFFDFIATLQYLDIIQARNMAEVTELIQLNDELSLTRAALDEQRNEASEQQTRAADALAQAVAKRTALEEEARAQAAAEAAARAQALEAASKQAGQSFETSSGQKATIEVPTVVEPSPSNESADTGNSSQGEVNTDREGETEENTTEPEPTPEPAPVVNSRDNFVSVWAGRIDAYLAGSPLAGYGYAFAEAAWDYGVDPRWSPAIACIESGKGTYCYASHNAWGWGGINWPNWDTAIRSHVAGLASGYGYTISVSAAKKYCPPTYSEWYSSVLSQMQIIWPTDSL